MNSAELNTKYRFQKEKTFWLGKEEEECVDMCTFGKKEKKDCKLPCDRQEEKEEQI